MNQTTRVLVWLGGLVLVVAIVGVLGVMLAVHFSQRRLDDYKRALEQRGEHFDIASLTPPPPPERNNGAKELIAICQEIKGLVEEKNIPRLTLARDAKDAGMHAVSHLQPTAFAREKGQNKETTLEWPLAVSDFEPLFERWPRLRSSASSAFLEIQPDYSGGVSMQIPGLTEILTTAQYLSSMALISLQQGNLDAATNTIIVQLKLAAMMQKQPTVISYLVAASVVGIAQTSTWELLQNAAVSPPQLARLQKAWEQIDLTGCLIPALRMERACMTQAFDLPAAQVFSIALGAASPTSSRSKLNWSLWDMLFRPADERRLYSLYQELIDAGLNAKKEQAWANVLEVEARLQNEVRNGSRFLIFTRLNFPSTAASISKLITSQALTSLSVAAIAAKRYQIDRGSFPDSLQALVPDYLSQVPLDPIDGKPLRYRQIDPEDFLLYSIGSNGTDEGGDASRLAKKRSLLDGKDIVWPKPATGN